jgi:hypothetical protein
MTQTRKVEKRYRELELGTDALQARHKERNKQNKQNKQRRNSFHSRGITLPLPQDPCSSPSGTRTPAAPFSSPPESPYCSSCSPLRHLRFQQPHRFHRPGIHRLGREAPDPPRCQTLPSRPAPGLGCPARPPPSPSRSSCPAQAHAPAALGSALLLLLQEGPRGPARARG